MNTRATNSRVCFVNRFYAPDISATAQILTDVSAALVDRGYQVAIITSRMSYDGSQVYRKREQIEGVDVHRVWSTRFGRGSTLGRALDYLTFYVSVTLAALIWTSKDDLIVAKTDPPALSIPLAIVARFKRATLINWLQDVFPEVAIELGYGASESLAISVVKKIRNWSLRAAQMNVVIGERMAKAVSNVNVRNDRIMVIQNFVDDESIQRSDSYSPELRQEWGLTESDFVVGYSGNLGRAHDLVTILEAAQLLKGSPEIKFLFIGGGHLHGVLEKEIVDRQLPNVLVKPYQARARLNESLALPNLHWASLVPELEDYIVPSKVYGIAAAGRTLMMVGDPNGEIGRLVSEHRFGVCVHPGESKQAKQFIEWAQRNPGRNASMGEAARLYLDRYASRDRAISRWSALMQRLSQSP